MRKTLKLFVASAAVAWLGVYPAHADQLNGKWSGQMHCGPLSTNPDKSPAFDSPISMVVSGRSATITRDTARAIETLQGGISGGKNASLSGEGRFKDGSGKPWITKIDGAFSSGAFTGSGGIFAADGSKWRDCGVKLSLVEPEQPKALLKPVAASVEKAKPEVPATSATPKPAASSSVEKQGLQLEPKPVTTAPVAKQEAAPQIVQHPDTPQAIAVPTVPEDKQVAEPKIPPIPNVGNIEGVPTIEPNEPYSQVRQEMLKAGWTPYHSPTSDICSDSDQRCQNRPEMESCAGSGMANCRFLWAQGGRGVAIFTVGEDTIATGMESVNLPKQPTTIKSPESQQVFQTKEEPKEENKNIGFIAFVLNIISSIWVFIDAKKLGVKHQANGIFLDFGPFGWMVVCFLLWIIAFPLYLIKRPEFKRLNIAQKQDIDDVKDREVVKTVSQVVESIDEKSIIDEKQADSNNVTYRVLLSGLQPGASSSDANAKLATLFKATPEQTSRLLMTPNYVIKKNLSLKLADKYKVAIEATGANCLLEKEVPQEPLLTLDIPSHLMNDVHQELSKVSSTKDSMPPVMVTTAPIDNTFVWLLVAVPIVGAFIERAISGGAEHSSFAWVGYMIANTILCILDANRLKAAGRQAPSIVWLLLIPVYLWRRASSLGQPPNYFWAWLVAFVMHFFVLSGTNSAGAAIFDSGEVKQVKSGVMQLCPAHTVDKMVNGFMGSPTWKSGRSADGRVFVNVEGDITFHDKPVRAQLQFIIEGNNFSFNAFEMNGVPSANLIAIGMLNKMCESAMD